jgi:hypothetical protein
MNNMFLFKNAYLTKTKTPDTRQFHPATIEYQKASTPEMVSNNTQLYIVNSSEGIRSQDGEADRLSVPG